MKAPNLDLLLQLKDAFYVLGLAHVIEVEMYDANGAIGDHTMPWATLPMVPTATIICLLLG